MTQRHLFANPEIAEPSLQAHELQKILAIQQKILGKAVVCEEHDQLLDELCLLAESFTPNAVATVMLVDHARDELSVSNAPSLSEEAIEAFNGLRSGTGSCGNAVFHDEAMYVCNTLEDARWAQVLDLAKRYKIVSCFSFPIHDEKGNAIGSFAISSFQHREPSGFHQALLETCTSICGVILQRKADNAIRQQILEEQLKSKKLASLGVLAGGIAHDFNNLLSAILGNLDLAMEDLPSGETRSNLEWASKAVDRASDLTQQLLTFSRGGSPIKKPNDIESIIRESAEFVLRGSKVAVQFEPLDDELPRILNVDAGQIGQLIQNLVINARQAMSEGGVVEIRCDVINALNHGTLSNGRYLKIEIQDSGPGIPVDQLERIFDPYFTTRAEGNGLGLSLCYSIVRNHGGYIRAESSNNGACFTIFLPVDETLELQKEVEQVPLRVKYGGCVIVMDDDDLVRGTVANMMERCGFEVLQAKEGTEVLAFQAAAAATDRPIDLYIIDLTVPGGMGGVETKNELRRREPDAKIVVASGYSEDQVLSDHTSHGFDAAVAKPFRSPELKRVVADLLGTGE